MPTPNLYLATQKLFQPHRWFSRRKPLHREEFRIEHRDSPVPGTYEYRPGRGWYLTVTDEPYEKLSKPIPIKYSRVLQRNLLQPDYDSRKCLGKVKGEDGKMKELGFFKLDGGVAFVNHLDAEGNFIPGPYKLWCVDKTTGEFRPMLKRDDPDWQSRHSSRAASTISATKSDQKSVEGEGLANPRHPNGSKTTDGRSLPPSRPSSPKRHHASPQVSRPPSVVAEIESQPSTRPSSERKMSTGAFESDFTAPTSPCSSVSSSTSREDLSHQAGKMP